MARLSLLALLATIAMAGASGVLASSDAAQALEAADVDEAGNVMQYINSVFGDEDDDDYSEEELARRDLMRRGKHHHKHSRKTKGKQHFTIGTDDSDQLWDDAVKITWYASNDLKNPQCGNGGGKWQPENSSHIGAVVKGWDNGPQCGDFVKLCNKKADNKCVKVRVIDKCAGCKKGHVDLTKSAFKKLAPSGTLNEGVVENLQMYKTYKPNPWDIALFGPKLLQALNN
ncbi:uncharacterized protein PFL1_03711 [Pseudozyma flocculosa PF-1]|uniref:Uncharacterized protein n=2 Tax=Pseudozyma flocculosa TaxID=84751 RepID=A0A5C3F257_9BASI|nr:uncharacterized protein PFL1_03711 [Pseudozyma flocculosa PF-1]EPQ28910.1 hypothetical protein PFL1_03711 [Pseudozyma flocculosa PF-1]SPO38603.1 uncharacterized protein PSFLO_04081 [Pseudozyma flocculosa]